MYGSQYPQVFTNNNYFDKFYPIYSKIKSGQALKLFCQQFGVPEKLAFYGSKEHACKEDTFIKEAHRKCIDYHISEPELHKHNPAQGVIREVGQKLYYNMVLKRVIRQLLDCGVSWVSYMMSMNHS